MSTLGNGYMKQLELSKTTIENKLYEGDSLISGGEYKKYLDLVSKTIQLWNDNQNSYNEKYTLSSKLLYDYILISNDEIKFYNNKLNRILEGLNITKYIPLSPKYYTYLEIFNKYNLLETLTHSDNILYFGYTLAPIEYIKYSNYKIKNITSIIPTFGENKYQDTLKEWNKYKITMRDIYNIDVIDYQKSIYDLPYETFKTSATNKHNLVIYTIYDFGGNVFMYENYLNIPNIFVGALTGLKHTNIGGTFILNLGSVAYKHLADIYIIVSKYFENSDLYYPEISNLFKKTGTIAIFRNFKGITEKDYNELCNLLDEIKIIYPNGSNSFNIYTPEVRKQFKITKPIDNDAIKTHIIGFLNYRADNTIYDTIRDFNTSRYLKQSIYMTKLLNYIGLDKSILEAVKIPSNEQLTNSILYCRKWDIPYWDKYSSKPFHDKFGRQILSETYGLHQPIMYHFKTPYKFHTVSRITLRFPSNKSSKSTISSKSSIYSKSSLSRISSNRKMKTKKITNSKLRISDFMRDIKLSRPAHDLSFRSTTKAKTKSKYKSLISLIPELDYAYNRIEQVGRLIDARRDFSKTGDMQYTKWWEVNKAFRYYKHKDDLEKIHLDQVVRTKLKDTSISQAWLKMYEIITDCRLIPTASKGTFHSFHICEAPGTFINAMNNYIHTKTKYTGFEWHAQSLNPKIARIKDQFGMIRRNPERWDYGADQTGDITKVRNIQYYKKQVSKRAPINLMTSDCGLAMKEPGYEKVAFASLLAILDILPVNGTMVYKILTPIDEPIILNLVYVAYCNFKELVFYKPVQNNHSREFYIIGKGYLGTNSDILEKFYDVLKQFKDTQKDDLFKDKYPEAFVRQFVDISNQLADNYIYTIERNIYYLDNFEKLTPEFIKLMKDYYDEKNQDWLDKYKPLRMESDVDKL